MAEQRGLDSLPGDVQYPAVSLSPLEQALGRAQQLLQQDAAAARHLAREVAQQAAGAANPWWQGRALRLVGAACLDLAALDEAETALQEGLALALQVGDPAGELGCRADLGYVRLDQGRVPEAQALLLAALSLAEALNQPEDQGYVHNALGWLHEAVQDLPAALHHYTHALAFRQGLGDSSGVARTLANIGNLHFHLEDFQAAQRAYSAALEVFEGRGEHAHAATARLNIALQLLSQDQLEAAHEMYDRALDQARQAGATETEARCLEHLGALSLKLQHWEPALEYAQGALTLAREHGAVTSVTSTLLLLGEVQLRRGQLNEAATSLREADELAEAAGLQATQAQAADVLAQVYAAQYDFVQAYHTARRVATLERQHRAAQQAEHTTALLMQFEVAQTARREEALQQHNRVLAGTLSALEAVHREKDYLLGRVQAQATLLEREARQDALTQLPNRRAFDQALQDAAAQAANNHTSFSVVFADLDAFKQVNDRYFHAVGDRVLVQVASILQVHLPPSSGALAARYGGEEFAVLLPGLTVANAQEWAEEARRAVEEHPWSALQPDLHMTVSLGVAQWTPAHAPTELLQAADRALYTAKRQGRNRVCSESVE